MAGKGNSGHKGAASPTESREKQHFYFLIIQFEELRCPETANCGSTNNYNPEYISKSLPGQQSLAPWQ